VCAWVIGIGGGIGVGVGVGGGGGGCVGRTSATIVCRDPVQPRFGHMSSCRPHRSDDYLSVPDVQRKKCYKIPPENELCLCEDIFQQHQAKLVNCDVEDANAVESYKEPGFDSDDNATCSGDDGGGHGNENQQCCCEGGGSSGSGSESSSSSSSSASACKNDVDYGRRKSSGTVSSSTVADDARALRPADGRECLPADRLTAEEREKVLRELDDIVTGNFPTEVRRFSRDVPSDSSGDDRYLCDLSNDQRLRSTAELASSRLRCKRSSSLDTDEMVSYGKVAELTRRFSKLGEAGIIAPRHYCSEPNFFRESTTGAAAAAVRHLHYRHHDEDTSSSGGFGGGSVDDYEVVRQPIRMVFISPMSASDDLLNGRSSSGGKNGGVVLTEVTSDGENGSRRTLNAAAQYRRRSFRKSVAFDSSLSSVEGEFGGGGGGGTSGNEAVARYVRLKGGGGGWQSAVAAPGNLHSRSTDTVSVSNVGRTHRRYSSVDVYDRVAAAAAAAENSAVDETAAAATTFLDVEKTEKEFRDGLLAEKSRRREAIQEYLANKELLLMKMKSASVGGVLRWNQEHQDTLLDDEEPPVSLPLRDRDRWRSSQQWWSSDDTDDESLRPKDGLRRVLHTGLKGRRIRRFKMLESRNSGFALTDVCRVSNVDEPPSSLPHCSSTDCSSAEPLNNRNNSL